MGLERRAVERSLDLAIARAEIEEAAQALGIARPFGLFSDAELGVTSEREGDGAWAVGPAFSFPLPIFNQGQPAVASAQAAFRSFSERYIAQATELRSQVRVAQAAVTAARERVVYYEQVVLPLRQQIVDQTQFRYNAMQVGAFQLLQAKKEQIETGSEYIRALLEYWLAHTEREQLLNGRMTSFEGMGDMNDDSSSESTSGEGDH